jgi:hypothetical protein
MRKMIAVSSFLLFSFVFTLHSLAQDGSKASESSQASEIAVHYYHLEFIVQELSKEGKPTNSRTYTTTVSTDSHGTASIRTNSKIPIVVSETSTNNASSPNVQFQYQDIGVNIDAMRAREVGHQLSVDLTANITSVAENLDARLHEPIIRQNKWQAVVLIPIGKATVVFTSDALDSKGSMQLVVTATPVQ